MRDSMRLEERIRKTLLILIPVGLLALLARTSCLQSPQFTEAPVRAPENSDFAGGRPPSLPLDCATSSRAEAFPGSVLTLTYPTAAAAAAHADGESIQLGPIVFRRAPSALIEDLRQPLDLEELDPMTNVDARLDRVRESHGAREIGIVDDALMSTAVFDLVCDGGPKTPEIASDLFDSLELAFLGFEPIWAQTKVVTASIAKARHTVRRAVHAEREQYGTIDPRSFPRSADGAQQMRAAYRDASRRAVDTLLERAKNPEEGLDAELLQRLRSELETSDSRGSVVWAAISNRAALSSWVDTSTQNLGRSGLVRTDGTKVEIGFLTSTHPEWDLPRLHGWLCSVGCRDAKIGMTNISD